MLLKWADYALKGEANDYATGAPVRLFVMGENVWRDEQEFPLARARSTRYYLHAAKGANSRRRRRPARHRAPRARSRPTASTTTPRTPCARWAAACAAATSARTSPGPSDQRPNESRADVLVYSTPPLAQDMEVTGFITAEIWAATSARRHRLHGHARGRRPLGLRALPRRRHPARALPRVARARGAARARDASRSTRSTSGPPATCSRPATSSGCTSRAATSRASTAT